MFNRISGLALLVMSLVLAAHSSPIAVGEHEVVVREARQIENIWLDRRAVDGKNRVDAQFLGTGSPGEEP
ncbi:hypothetical protein M413DRAFT_25551 [Hebeloma cylindrosporum]|uniref:Uncharacterized protein n=1 Tax=Hebeloma cylindrosporum TaxID=76867 RepID=A0A0C2YSU5_HEBCY|nr:hypothetical protein M413DRAFT_25551 [Hebeloma cylindrosporum h7]